MHWIPRHHYRFHLYYPGMGNLICVRINGWNFGTYVLIAYLAKRFRFLCNSTMTIRIITSLVMLSVKEGLELKPKPLDKC